MSRADAVLGVGKLVAAFRQEKISKETVEIYVDQLSHLTTRALDYAIEQAIRTSRYFPAVADVLDRAGECPPPTQRYLEQGTHSELDLPLCPSCGVHFAILAEDELRPCLWCLVAARDGKKHPLKRAEEEEDEPPPAE